MSVFYFQGISALLMFIRMLVIMRLGGVDAFGVFGVLTVIITLCSVPVQLLNNQRVQVVLLEDNEIARMGKLNAVLVVYGILSIISSALITIFGQYYNGLGAYVPTSMLVPAIISAVLLSYVCGYYDLRGLTEGRLRLYYGAAVIGSFAGVMSSVVLLKINSQFVVYIPSISSFCILMFYVIIYSYRYNFGFFGKRIKPDYQGLIFLLKTTWSLSTIPLYNVIVDFVVRTSVLAYLGASGVGYYQAIISVEALVGNVLMGPFYKKILVESARGVVISFSKLSKYIFLITLLPLIAALVVNFLNYFFQLKHPIFEIIFPFALVIIFRYPFNLWGGLGQILIVKGKHNFVAKTEIFSKTMVSGLFVLISAFFHAGFQSYIYSVAVTSIIVGVIVYYGASKYYFK